MLPRHARERLAQPLRETCEEVRPLHASHTLPIEAALWGWYSNELVERLRELAAGLEHFPSDTSYGSLSKHVESLVASRSSALSVLYALEPFAPFGREIAQRILEAVDKGLAHAAIALEDGTKPPRSRELWQACNEWPHGLSDDDEVSLNQLFGLDEEPVDDIGDLKPGWVLAAYKYDGAGLLNQLAPHLSSLGLPMTRDVLAMTSVIGWISGAPDPVVAYISLDSLANRLAAASPALTDQVLGYFRQRERGRHQARRRILRTITGAAASDDPETRALATTDIYKRLVEGSVRQFGWALRCLQIGAWSAPPVLARVREAMLASGGFARRIAEDAVLVGMRNGEAHEDLEWDGVHDHYVVDGAVVVRDKVVTASVIALSFDRGCEAALAYHRATRLPMREAALTPTPDEQFSMPAWQRAEAYFGSNGLRVLRSELNARTARVWLPALEMTQVNPCFQALISVQQLLPTIETFEVCVEGRNEPVIEVSAGALAINVPVWTQALENLDVMPIVTFLPANFAARFEVESPSKASRSAAWMAADGVLDALDGGPGSLDESGVTLLVERLRLVETAVEHCLLLMPEANQTRLRSVVVAVRELLDGMTELRDRPLSLLAIEALQPVGRIRHVWSAWGPVKRHPNVPEPPPPAHIHERLPGRWKGSRWLRL